MTRFSLTSRKYCLYGLEPWLLRLLADRQEKMELEISAHADARMRVAEISPSLAGQIWSSQDV